MIIKRELRLTRPIKCNMLCMSYLSAIKYHNLQKYLIYALNAKLITFVLLLVANCGALRVGDKSRQRADIFLFQGSAPAQVKCHLLEPRYILKDMGM